MTDALTRAERVDAPVRTYRIAALFGCGLVALAITAGVHVTQGTSSVGASDLMRLVVGDGDDNTWNVLVASRLPRLLAGIVVGFALGVAGAIFQSLARNSLASPDTLGVNAGAYVAVTAVAAFGISLPLLAGGLVAFAGGLLAAAIVLALSSGSAAPTRLILAGSATALALQSTTAVLLLLFEEETSGLFAWGSGALTQLDLGGVRQMGPVVIAGIGGVMLLAHKLDLLALGDDTAAVLGTNVRRTRLTATLIAVLLTSAAVALAGPIGFVGLCAPAAVRLIGVRVTGVHRHLVLLPLSGIAGALVVLVPDVLMRAVVGSYAGIEIPTGVVTTILGATVLVVLARQHRDSGPTRQPPAARPGGHRSVVRFRVVCAVLLVVLVSALLAALLLGNTMLLTGDIANYLSGQAGLKVTYVLDERVPRALASMLAGLALAVSGVVVQAVCRNPLAEPGLLGITAGAGVGAVSLLVATPLAGVWAMTGAAGLGSMAAFALVYAMAWRGGLSSDRLVLIGIGVWAGASAITNFIVIRSDPWNTSLALTWLSGSTYGRTLEQVIPVAVALAVFVPLIAFATRELDLMALDDDTPRVLGVRLEHFRLLALAGAAIVTSTAVSAVGVIGFVGLVAPHAARALVGGRHTRVLWVAALLGAILVSVADTIGRTVIAPAQIPAGLVTALVGAPYFVYLLWRSKT